MAENEVATAGAEDGIEVFISMLKDDRKKLLKDKAFGDPNQLRSFIGHYLYPRLVELVQMFGGALGETFNLGVVNAQQLQQLQEVVADIEYGGSSEDSRVLDDVTEQMDEFMQRYYALVTHLAETYPQDKRTEELVNICNEAVLNIQKTLVMDSSDDGDAEEDDVAAAAEAASGSDDDDDVVVAGEEGDDE